ncbi:protein kinase [Blastocystis sp. ATCC 50177/Nand II]|uniref:Protein kinase n=1 Tax=Blastocystis sp. subtype 1 (strain ATCC 50177 / NandII) TaxID=478820 RepID=A0A196S7W7_BLAHN|nr:protein kinase [Blastocystis sp. ATCC 50177/Nand II]
MGRMYGKGKGISASCLPYKRTAPSWLKTTSAEVEASVCRLAKKGLTPSQIGVLLRDQKGIGQVKAVTGSKILRILKKNGRGWPENLLLDADGHIKITDFGLSKENASGEELHSLCGTPEYLAPEIILKKAYGMAVDWWSLGTLIYEMISGLPPFYDKNRRVMYNKILSAPLSRCPYMSAEISLSLGVGALTPRVRPRLGSGSFEDVMKHPWFRDIDWEKLYKKEVVPPFKPVVSGAEDVRNVDSVFLEELPAITPTFEGKVLTDPDAFTGFSYNPNPAHSE